MPKIITITLNPSLDKSITVPQLVPEKKLRCSSSEVDPGGGGVNVSRALHKLGLNSLAVFLSGGYTGKKLEELLMNEEVDIIALPIKEATRENFIVFDEEKRLQYRFGMEGAAVTDTEWKAVLNYVSEQTEVSYIVASGSLPPGVPMNFFGQLAALAKKINAKLIVDTSGEALEFAAKEGLYMLKPNLNELSSLIGKTNLAETEIVSAARTVINSGGCEIMVVSLGGDGALLVTAEDQYKVKPPKVTVMSTVGAGDSMVGGILYALSKGCTYKEILMYGVAAGTAATLHPGTELCKKEDTERIFAMLK